MKHATPSTLSDAARVACKQPRIGSLEKSYRKSSLSEENEREWFARVLWQAFPEAQSENHLSELVAEVLTTDKRPIHPKTVRNWLRCQNAPHFRYVLRILALAGAERVFEIIDPEVS
ncbi:hypothetical protein [Pseudaestuariivita rosea]|uniref:hypothetical protein n=1 Tax=Pseudaestuariivita rosea TaxID=2763263 RepID=UPI001F2590B8|nr:hypothetical protein [Pseudaestuariivita rosea]